jgi:hypothetical protein
MTGLGGLQLCADGNFLVRSSKGDISYIMREEICEDEALLELINNAVVNNADRLAHDTMTETMSLLQELTSKYESENPEKCNPYEEVVNLMADAIVAFKSLEVCKTRLGVAADSLEMVINKVYRADTALEDNAKKLANTIDILKRTVDFLNQDER